MNRFSQSPTDGSTITGSWLEASQESGGLNNNYADIYSHINANGNHVLPYAPGHLPSGTYPTFSTAANLGFWHADVPTGSKVVIHSNASDNWLGFGGGVSNVTTESAIEIPKGSLSNDFHTINVGLPTDTTPMAIDFGSSTTKTLDFDIFVSIRDTDDNALTFSNYNDYSTTTDWNTTTPQSTNQATIGAKALITKYEPSVTVNGGSDITESVNEGSGTPASLQSISAAINHLSRNGNTVVVSLTSPNDKITLNPGSPTTSDSPSKTFDIGLTVKDDTDTSGAQTATLTVTSSNGGLGWRSKKLDNTDNTQLRDDETYTQSIDISVTYNPLQQGGGGAFSTSAASVPFTTSPDFDDFPDTVPATEEYFSETDAIACYEINSEETWTGWAAFRQLSIDWEFDDPGTNKWDIYNQFNVNNDDPSMWSLDDTITAVPDLTLDKFGSNDVTDTLMYNMTQSHQFYTTKGGTQGTTVNPPAGVAWGNGLAYVMDVNGDNLVGFEFFNGKSTSDTMADATGGSTASDLNNPIQATIGLNYYVSETVESSKGTVANSIYTTSLAAYNSTIGANFTTPTSYTRNVATAAAADAGTHTFIKKSETI